MMMINGTAAGTPRGAVSASNVVSLIGTRQADFVKTSGQTYRANRPDT